MCVEVISNISIGLVHLGVYISDINSIMPPHGILISRKTKVVSDIVIQTNLIFSFIRRDALKGIIDNYSAGITGLFLTSRSSDRSSARENPRYVKLLVFHIVLS